MIKNYFLIAIRTLKKDKIYPLINILGLAIGMCATILILLYVTYELSYDRYHTKSERIYRLSREWLNDNGESSLHLGHLAPPFAPLIKNDFEGIVEEAVRVISGGESLITSDQKKLIETEIFFADAEVFKVFSWDFISGDPNTALIEPNTMVITQSTAEKFFGEIDPMGKQIVWENFGLKIEMKITGVVKDIPKNSHFTWHMFCSFGTLENVMGKEELMRNWGSNNYSTYLLFKDEIAHLAFEKGIPAFFDNHLSGDNTTEDNLPSKTNKLHLWKLSDIHLNSHLDSEIGQNGDMEKIYVFLIIAILILVIACINFMNLSTARSMKRAKEVGLRKVMGAFRSSLIRQFLMESVIYATISLIIALIAAYLFMPNFINFTEKPLSLNPIENTSILYLLGGIVLFVGVVAGSYPAFYLSKFQPSSILKGAKKIGKSSFSLRSGLVVFQFMISASLIISVMIVGDQLDFVKSKELGFDKQDIMLLPSPDNVTENFDQLKRKLEKIDGVKNVSIASRVPSGRLLDSSHSRTEVNGEMTDVNFRIANISTDFDYLPSLGVTLAAGRFFNPDLASDSLHSFIINEATVNALGWENAESAIGKPFQYDSRTGYIIGVVRDFHFESLHQKIAPMVFLITKDRASTTLIRIDGSKRAELEKLITEEWSFLRPGFPLEIEYLSDSFDAQYIEEDKLSEVIYLFSGLAIFIAILGLFGLSSFTTEQRIKEIGIRKTLGATNLQLLVLLGKSFVYLILFGFLLAIPISYYLLNTWLSNFAYATTITNSPYILSISILLIIAMGTIGVQTLKAADKNPVDSLKYE